MIWMWIGFVLFILAMLAIDLGVFHRRAHAVSLKESLVWSSVWITMAMLFALFIFFLFEYRLFGISPPEGIKGRHAAVLFVTGYIIEESLSVDNLFVIALIMAFFRVPADCQHRVLFWGILGAMVMRAIMILLGAALVHTFAWVLYIFGAFLVFTAIKMFFADSDPDPSKNFLVRQVRRVLPVSDEFDGLRFVTRSSGRRALTPLALALLAVESADVIFAVDSIPAIFAITDIPFLVFTSNIFAILGLRSMYFALAGIMRKFRYLKVSLSVLLAVIGAKMLLKDLLEDVPGMTYWTLGLVVVILSAGVVASVAAEKAGQEKR
ncbi:MAG: TerC family protein [Phycisphaerae bacterium]